MNALRLFNPGRKTRRMVTQRPDQLGGSLWFPGSCGWNVTVNPSDSNRQPQDWALLLFLSFSRGDLDVNQNTVSQSFCQNNKLYLLDLWWVHHVNRYWYIGVTVDQLSQNFWVQDLRNLPWWLGRGVRAGDPALRRESTQHQARWTHTFTTMNILNIMTKRMIFYHTYFKYSSKYFWSSHWYFGLNSTIGRKCRDVGS